MKAFCTTSSGLEEVEGVEWQPLKRGDKLPQRCVYAGNTSTDGMIFVGRRTDHKESGKINTDREHDPAMWNLWTHMNGSAKPHEAEILVVSAPNKIAEWTAICQGDPLPPGTVHVGKSWRGRDLYVGRNISGQCGKLTVDKHGNAGGFWSHGGNFCLASKDGDVLVVRDNNAGCSASSSSNLQEQLSYVGRAVETTLRNLHEENHGGFWNVSRGKVGKILQTPPENHWGKKECLPRNEHSNELPETMYETIVKAEKWVDFTSLSPPTGKFMERIKDAIRELDKKAKKARSKMTIRFLFGNIPLKPVDCNALLRELKPTESSYISMWVGSYRVGLTSWNHSKIIAVDGKYLVQGGHNCWDEHYLKHNPIHDISMEVEGLVTYDAHMFCNKLWRCLIDLNREYTVSKAVPLGERTGISHWPKELCKYPPMYLESPVECKLDGTVPMISIGRHGEVDVVDGVDRTEIVRQRWPVAIRESRADKVVRERLGCAERTSSQQNSNNVMPPCSPTSTHSIPGSMEIPKPVRPTDKHPADSAIRTMLTSATKTIRLSIQDLGCLILPCTEKTPIPGGTWPYDYLEAMAEALFNGVKVEIVLSNILAVPGSMTKWQCRYGNGWTCVDGAAEIAKALKKKHPEIDDDRVKEILKNLLSLTYIRSQKGVKHWPDGANIGNHAKFIIIDDLCYYMGSQNLYVCNLAEWGIIVDDKAETQKTIEQYWNPMWRESYCERDCPLDEVMAAITVNRDGVAEKDATEEEKERAKQAQRLAAWQVSNANCEEDSNQVYDWIKIKRGEAFPAGSVEAGESKKDGLNFVGRNRGAAGKITCQASDALNMCSFSSHSQSTTKDAEVLVVRGKGIPEWRRFKRGDPIPEAAVCAGVTQMDGILYVGRAQGEAGKIKTNWQDSKEMQRPPDPGVALCWMFGDSKNPLACWSQRLLPDELAKNLEAFMQQHAEHKNRPIFIKSKSKIGFISPTLAIEWLRSCGLSDDKMQTIGCCRMEYFFGKDVGCKEEAEILCIERPSGTKEKWVEIQYSDRYDEQLSAYLGRDVQGDDVIKTAIDGEMIFCALQRFSGEELQNRFPIQIKVKDSSDTCMRKSCSSTTNQLNADEVKPCEAWEWVRLKSGESIPSGAVCEGKLCVGRFADEVGKITTKDNGNAESQNPVIMNHFKGCSNKSSNKCEILVILPGVELKWAHISRGEEIPADALFASSNNEDGHSYVGLFAGEIGKITLVDGTMSSFHGHSSGKQDTAQILRVIVRGDD